MGEVVGDELEVGAREGATEEGEEGSVERVEMDGSREGATDGDGAEGGAEEGASKASGKISDIILLKSPSLIAVAITSKTASPTPVPEFSTYT